MIKASPLASDDQTELPFRSLPWRLRSPIYGWEIALTNQERVSGHSQLTLKQRIMQNYALLELLFLALTHTCRCFPVSIFHVFMNVPR